MNDTVILTIIFSGAATLILIGFALFHFIVTDIKNNRKEQDCTGGRAEFSEYNYEHSETEDYKKFLKGCKHTVNDVEEGCVHSEIEAYIEVFDELNSYSRGECLYSSNYELGADQWLELERQILNGEIDITDIPLKIKAVNFDLYTLAFRYARGYALNNNNDYLKYQNICDTMKSDIEEIVCLHCKYHLIKRYLNHCYYEPYIEYLNAK